MSATPHNLRYTTHGDRRPFVESVGVDGIQEAERLQRIVDAAVPRIREVERAIQEPWLHHTLDVLASGNCGIGIPVVDEILRTLRVLWEV